MHPNLCYIVFMFCLMAFCSNGQSELGYIENKGQWPSEVIAAKTLGPNQVFLKQNGIRFNVRDHGPIAANHRSGQTFAPQTTRIKGHVYEVNFVGSSLGSTIHKNQAHTGYVNYFLNEDPQNWASHCIGFDAINMEEIYPGIDFKLYQQDGLTKYDFIVQPGANASLIQMSYHGMDNIRLEHGRIRIGLSIGEVYEQSPIAWQIIDGQKHFVGCTYELHDNTIGFRLGSSYKPNWPLIIDPQIVFSTYSGSESDNFGYSATFDEDGNLYSGSSAFGQGYPTTLGAFQLDHQGGDSAIEDGIDMAISKYSADGTTMLWSTFIGGSGDDLPHSLIVNSSNELYIYGCSGSDDFPVSTDAYQNQFLGGSAVSPIGTGATFPNGTDIVVLHLNSTGSNLIGSTYLGGGSNDGINSATLLKRNYADEFRGEISLDALERPIIVSSTFSGDFPIVSGFQNTLNGGQEGLVARLNPNLSSVQWSSFIGGSGDDSGFSLVAANDGSLYVTGGTTSANFQTTSNAYQPNHAGVVDGYVIHISANGNTLLSSTLFGATNFDQVYFIELDDQGAVYGYGQSISSGSNLINNVGYSQSNSGMLLFKMNSSLSSLVWSTVIGTGNGNPNLSPSAFLVDYCHRIYISGWGVAASASPLNPGTHLFPMGDLEVTSDAEFPTSTTGDFYMAVFDEDMTTLEYATFYGGNTSSEHVDGGTSRFDRKGVIYQSVCAGCGSNDDFPIFPTDAWSPTNNSNNCNNGVFKFDFQLPITVADFEAPTGCVNTPISFSSTSVFAQTYTWDFGDENTSNLPNPTHVYIAGGVYEVTLIVTHPMTCNLSDTLTLQVEIIAPSTTNLDNAIVCDNAPIAIGPTDPLDGAQYTWSPSNFLSFTDVAQPLFTPGITTLYEVLVDHGGCIDTLTQLVEVIDLTLTLPNDTVMCNSGSLQLEAQYSPDVSNLTWSDIGDLSNMLNDSFNDPDISVMIEVPTVFYAQLEYQQCTFMDSVVVQLVEFQTEIEGDFAVCAGDTTILQILIPNPLFDYFWTPANQVINGQNSPFVQVVVPVTTVFTVVSQYNNCSATDQVEVTVSPLSGAFAQAQAQPTTIVQGQTVNLLAQPNGYTYLWEPVEMVAEFTSQNTSSEPSGTTTYYLTISDGECTAQDSVTVRVVEFVCGPPSIYVPNAFTPNLDGVNEKLYVRANNIDALLFVIYDRWGEKMFETQSLKTGWDGNYEGRILPPDVYTYYLEATCLGGTTYFEKGNITLIR